MDYERERVVLASASPQRRRLLEQVGIPYSVYPVDIDETFPPGHGPQETACIIARAKAEEALRRLGTPHQVSEGGDGARQAGETRPDGEARQAGDAPGAGAVRAAPPWLIAADTVVWGPDGPLGKPADGDDAAGMIERLQGRTHLVVTAVGVAAAGRLVVEAESTRVTIAPMSRADIMDYVATDEWRGAAGGYRIQGIGSRHVPGIEGCYFTVVGLPIYRLCAILGRNGYRFR